MNERMPYEALRHPGGIRIGLFGFPGSGKTILSLAPHPILGVEPHSVLYLPFDEGAELLEGVPVAFVKDARIDLQRVGWQANGKRKTGKTFEQIVLDYVSRPLAAQTIILDTVTTAAELRKGDEPESEYGREYGVGQVFIVKLYRRLYENNPHLNILLLHHTDEIKRTEKRGNKEVQIFETYTPATVGAALNRKWAGRFSACLQTECTPKVEMVKGKPMRLHSYKIITRPTEESHFLKLRGGLVPVPPEIDFTVKPNGDYTPLLMAWDTIFQTIDAARAAKAALLAANTATKEEVS